MSLAACYIVYNDVRFLERSMASVIGHVDHIIICLGRKPWHGDAPQGDADKVVRRLAKSTGWAIRIEEGEWGSEVEQRNACQELAQSHKHDWSLIVDTDEIWTPEGMETLKAAMLGWHYVDYWRAGMWTYIKEEYYQVTPPERPRPTVAARTRIRFMDKRNPPPEAMMGLIFNQLVHHYAFVRTDGEMRDKLYSAEHHEDIREGWWERVWENFDPSMTDLHPYRLGMAQGVIDLRETDAWPKKKRGRR